MCILSSFQPHQLFSWSLCGKKPLWPNSYFKTLYFRYLVEWVTISVWPFSISRHHLLYSSISQEVPQHGPLGMVQHFINCAAKQQFFCFAISKWESKRSYNFWFWELVLPTLSTTRTSPLGKIPIAPHLVKICQPHFVQLGVFGKDG